jgi:hypothetical protein
MVLAFTGGTASVRVTRNPFDVPNTIRDALLFPQIENIVSDERFGIALEFYRAYFYEDSSNAKFLMLMLFAAGGSITRRVKREIEYLLATQVKSFVFAS